MRKWLTISELRRRGGRWRVSHWFSVTYEPYFMLDMSGASPTTRDAPFAIPTLEINFELAALEGDNLFAVRGDPAFLVAVNEGFVASTFQGAFARP